MDLGQSTKQISPTLWPLRDRPLPLHFIAHGRDLPLCGGRRRGGRWVVLQRRAFARLEDYGYRTLDRCSRGQLGCATCSNELLLTGRRREWEREGKKEEGWESCKPD
uniref:Uncharacterized protein n=1 Tax=Pristionchus pacificus TaxID=54126 RepID=A0A2A6B611_PRIPA|eukprot:PDM61319.1 hypothetical protein PRIPAC_50761 [Pristionchus pacificus]